MNTPCVKITDGIVTNEYPNGLPASVPWCDDTPYYHATHRHTADGIYPAQFAATPEGMVKTGSTWALVDGVMVETGEYITQAAYDAGQEAARQAAKPEKLKAAENKFFDLCFAVFGDRTKRGFDELNVTIQTLAETDQSTASALALQLLAVDAECKREGGNQWWDTAAYHEDVGE